MGFFKGCWVNGGDVVLLLIGVVGLMLGSDEGVGCVFVNLIGGLDDVQNVRVNVSWDPLVVKVIGFGG